MDKRDLIKRILQEGFNMRPECLVLLQDYFALLATKEKRKKISIEEAEPHLEKILENVRVLSQRFGGPIVEEETMKGAIELLLRPGNEHMEIEQFDQQIDENKQQDVNDIVNEKYLKSIVVLNTMTETPKFIVTATGKLQLDSQAQSKKQSVTLANANRKTEMFRKRFNIIKTLMQNSSNYVFFREQTKNATHENISNNTILLSDIGSLIGSQGQEKNVLGIIYEGLAGEYFLQDEVTNVKLDLRNAQIKQGYVTICSVVIAVGVYDQLKSEFNVIEVLLPNLDHYQGFNKSIDYFGAKTKVSNVLSKLIQLEIQSAQLNTTTSKKNPQSHSIRLQRQRQLEIGYFDLELNNNYFNIQDASDYCVCVISEFNITNSKVLSKFESVLQGFQSLKPLLFILMGPFFNEIINNAAQDRVVESIAELTAIICKYKSLRDNCYWLFVPHPNDIGGASMQPKCELPEEYFRELIESVNYAKLVQNPCRISFLGKSILIQRNDFLRDIAKKQIVLNSSQKDIHVSYIQTILSQRHLSPISLIHKPIIWNYDHTLSFIDIPDYLILADSYCEQFEYPLSTLKTTSEMEPPKKENEMKKNGFVINPGNFEKKSTFTFFYPLVGEIQAGSL